MNHRTESMFTDEQIDEVLDTFERNWSKDDGFLQEFVARESLKDSASSLAELVRADIDRRYAAGADVDLQRYFKMFPSLLTHKSSAHVIAYEDFRSRGSRGLSLDVGRWNWICNIQEAEWFKSLDQPVTATNLSIRPGTPALVRMDLEPQVGEAFGEFQLLSLLGVGAFSKVFLATQSSLAGRYVALKVVRQTLNEPTHLARLQHTGIVPLYSLHRIGSYSALCMPYYGSATLADWLGEQSGKSERNGQSLVTTVQAALNKLTRAEEGPQHGVANSLILHEADRIRDWNSTGTQLLKKLSSLDSKKFLLWFARHVAAALAHAHERGIIHGDLKPANILLRNDGEPALIDFNLSKENELKRSSWVGGTLPYMSPEQLRMMLGQKFDTSTSSDVYSLGLILFEVVENRLPFPAPFSMAESDIEAAIVAREGRLHFTNTNATAGFRAIIAKCLHFRPEDRYATASELIEDIQREAANLALTHTAESFLSSRVPKFIRRYPRIFSAVPVALLCLAIVTVSGIVANRWWRTSQASAAKSQFSNFEREARQHLPQLLSAKSDLANRLTSIVTQVEDFIGVTQDDLSQSANLRWLNDVERHRAEDLVFDYCLSSAAIASESWNSISEDEQTSVQQLLGYCDLVPARAKQSPILEQLRRTATIGNSESKASNAKVSKPLTPVEQLLLARVDVLKNRPDSALEITARVSELSRPEHSPFAHLYWLTAGDARARLGHYDAALMSYELAIGAAPDVAISFAQRASLRVAARDFKSAELDYSAAIQLSPQDVAYYVDRALVRERLLDFSGSREDLDQAMELSPDSNRIVLIRARIHQRLGNLDALQADLKRGMKTEPKTVEDWISRSLAQLPRFPDRSMRDLKSAAEIAPNSFEVLQNIAHVQSEHLKDVPAAVATLDKILAAAPDNEMALGGRCVLLARLGRVTESLRDFEALSQLGDHAMPATVYQMGCAHALLADKHEPSQATAIRYIAKALKRNYGAELLETDTDLDLIRESPEFRALVTTSKLALQGSQTDEN